MREIFDEIYQALLNGQEITVATIISDRGSTPRNSGSKLIVYPNSTISGTIGGGAIEGDVIQRALRLFETPAEIGVSIVAQLIQHRAKRKNHE